MGLYAKIGYRSVLFFHQRNWGHDLLFMFVNNPGFWEIYDLEEVLEIIPFFLHGFPTSDSFPRILLSYDCQGKPEKGRISDKSRSHPNS